MNANEIMKREALNGHYGVLYLDYFGDNEDMVIVHPTWEDVENFISSDALKTKNFEILTGTEFDLNIDDAVLVEFNGYNYKVICSRENYERKNQEFLIAEKIIENWRILEQQEVEMKKCLEDLEEIKENFFKHHSSRMKDLNDLIESVSRSVNSVNVEFPLTVKKENTEDIQKHNDIMENLDSDSKKLDELLDSLLRK